MTELLRYDIVGSFLRPEALKKARAQFEQGTINQAALSKVEDEEIKKLIAKQVENGLKSITDGEFRRSWWHLDFFWGLNGVEAIKDAGGFEFENVQSRFETARLNNYISGENHPFVEHYKFLKAHTPEGIEARQTVPAPARLFSELTRKENIEATKSFYPTEDELIDAIAKAYQTVIQDLYNEGLRTIQFDDTTWGRLVGDQTEINGKNGDAKEKERLKEIFVKANNKAIEGLPEDLTVQTHVCRGNYRSTWFAEGAYDSVASPLFDRENVDNYLLEYDTDRSGGFEPLAHVSEGKNVVLGLITSKDGKLEDRDEVIARIKEASQYIPLENLALSTQCGFASTEEGNNLTEEEQWAKIRLVKSIAEEVWKTEKVEG
ncbi:5-methyltetrahydropteroyltriglutamate--homocysteine S-methyltransferase [Staphylococcus condimenti]|uniref:5-methyltetrahydropteroyltriglutamate--homocysteine S-methyltransferase n=1 Tax=Staphylococcus condimenti TaxID=70255 RepID=A0A3S4UCK4_9STAP|nr:5-methyltetrahydropteroyltriglutamate--homocysteine S-methyltransferase [Staphylococcus condimenti]APR61962.1 5-methyltetrahydropteroyltriglutamate--homocysteine methyltransferase [Staphylococcus condimenti]MDK8645426.1 5-methyltetrahydropteroyltriglutamate--homocysteine S-methyltransferase [Staphylococcus condimenti]PNZ59849.1 5-methyltetrahydropteroyltriglutamate--homocysteine S-methyltransferase [Staphylococcus condimenti]QQS82443.1 5-methyltetrahydropteroyltriglutamate--homocysteine S-me